MIAEIETRPCTRCDGAGGIPGDGDDAGAATCPPYACGGAGEVCVTCHDPIDPDAPDALCSCNTCVECGGEADSRNDDDEPLCAGCRPTMPPPPRDLSAVRREAYEDAVFTRRLNFRARPEPWRERAARQYPELPARELNAIVAMAFRGAR